MLSPTQSYTRAAEFRKLVSPRSASQRCCSLAVVALSLLAWAALMALAAPLVADDGIELSFLTGTYRDLASQLEPIEQSGLTVWVTSPRHRLTVHGNRFWLSAEGGGVARASIEVDLDGEGLLEARLESAGIGSNFDDEVVLPRQTLRLAGRIKIEQGSDELILTVLEAPAEVSLEIDSDLASQLVGVCQLFGKLLPMDCGALRLSLSRVKAPLPAVGERFRLPESRLSPAELAYFKAVLAPIEDQVSHDKP